MALLILKEIRFRNKSTKEVITAASSKWNFLSVYPGLVGGHCIGIDPYYLIQGAEERQINLNIVKQARLTNENVIKKVVRTVKDFVDKITSESIKIGIWGLTYKKNTNDLRNSKAMLIYNLLNKEIINAEFTVLEPQIPELGTTKDVALQKSYDVLLILVNHSYFDDIDELELLKCTKNKKTLVIDVSGIYEKYTNFRKNVTYLNL